MPNAWVGRMLPSKLQSRGSRDTRVCRRLLCKPASQPVGMSHGTHLHDIRDVVLPGAGPCPAMAVPAGLGSLVRLREQGAKQGKGAP